MIPKPNLSNNHLGEQSRGLVDTIRPDQFFNTKIPYPAFPKYLNP